MRLKDAEAIDWHVVLYVLELLLDLVGLFFVDFLPILPVGTSCRLCRVFVEERKKGERIFV